MNPIKNVTPVMLDPAVKPITQDAWDAMTDGQKSATWLFADRSLFYPTPRESMWHWNGGGHLVRFLTDPRLPEFREAAHNSLKTSESSPVESAVPTTQSCSEIPDSSALKPSLNPRDSVLHGALRAVSQRDNEAAYGTGNSFDAAARIKAAIINACPTPVPGPVEIAVTQIAVKLARLAGSGFKHQDSAVDLCGYAAWLYELATRAIDEKEPKP